MALNMGSPAVVLVVDDEPLLRIEVALALEALGCGVIEAEHSRSALVELERHPEIAALFTDINMPGDSGLELARIVHRLRPDVHVFMTSGLEQPSGMEMPEACVFVGKPYAADKVAALIRERIALGPACLGAVRLD